MEPATAGALGGGLVLLGVGLALGIFVYGRSTRQQEIDTLQGLLDIANATIASLRSREVKRAAGAVVDMDKAIGLAGAAARGDLDGVLRYFPGSPDGSDTGEQGREADEGEGQGND